MTVFPEPVAIAKSMDALVALLTDEGVLKTPMLMEAIRRSDRADFIPKETRPFAYADYPLPIGFAQTISQPTTVAIMLEMLGVRAGDRILDVGVGSGWTTAILARLAGYEGRVFGTERIAALLRDARGHLAQNFTPGNTERIFLHHTTHTLGISEEAPFDRILVSAEAQELPDTLVRQLIEGGTLVIPINGALWKVKKHRGIVKPEQCLSGFSFAKLAVDEG